MKRFIISAAIVITVTLACADPAQARIFEPQPHWWSSGRTCIASRNPPGLAWEDLPPRACVVREAAAMHEPKTPVWMAASAVAESLGKPLVKI